uniref:Tyrosine-protein kinase n=1 Tax=Neogobius melanostomus TaxID=47308 RepID=A0A8C6S8J0_9GOBI
MDGCMRRICPCLVKLWDRGNTDVPAGDDPGEGGVVATPRKTPPPAKEKGSESGSIYVALWAFEARHEEELSFETGDMFNVLSRDGDWWKAGKIDTSGRVLGTGFVPNNYLERAESFAKQAWYFGTMNRFEAQENLMSPDNDNGAFLIRESDRDTVGYVLSVKSSTRVKHFKVMKDDSEQFHIEPSPHFSTLLDMVEHYSNYSLSGVGRLGKPCKRKKPEPTDLNHLIKDEWELPKEEFSLEEELGSGCFADVYRGRWKSNINVAIKIIKNSELNHQEFVREVEMLKRLRHRHLISLFAVCTESPPYYIVMELMEKGSLLQFLRGPEGQHQDIVSLVDMGAQVADGMSYLEENNCIHRDLAARNVLVGEGYICKVADFGLGRIIKGPFYVSEDKKIPYKWTAPEAISQGMFSSKSDVWSFGVLLYEIMTFGGNPYPGQRVGSGEGWIPHAPSPKCPEFLYNIMMECWSAEPENRPTFKSLKDRLDSSITSNEWDNY